MKKIAITVLISFCFFSSYAQKAIVLKGKILKDNSQSPIESATVYLIQPKDSSVVSYTISDKNGLFNLETKPNTQKSTFKVVADGYEDFSKDFDKLTSNKDLGIVYLKENVKALDEVVVKSMAPPVRVKKDTLEFNAASFKLNPDANVEALLRQLPGVTIDADKKIMVNGKEVNQILVNGKSFFGEDGKVALQNLPAELIKKVQVSDFKTEEEKFTKQVSSSDKSTLNLTIEKDKNKGFFGKFLAGYGTQERYESSALMSYFKDKRRISLLGSSNNINATGFSMDEVFDNMGGGRNSGSRAPNQTVGGGIVKSNLIGMNYSDEWFKGNKSDGNYRFNNSETQNTNKTTSLDLLPNSSNLSKSNSESKRESTDHNFDFNFQYEISPKTKLIFKPKISSVNSKSNSDYDSKTWNKSDLLINESDGFNSNETDKTNFANEISLFKSMKKKGRYFSADVKNDNSNSDSKSLVNLTTLFTLDPSKDIIRNQNVKTENENNKYSGNFQYSEPLTDSLSIRVQLLADYDKILEDKKTYDFDASTNSYSDLNELYSNFTTTSNFQIAPKAGFNINKKKFNLRVSTGTYMISVDHYSLYTGTTTQLTKNYIIPEGTVNFNYQFSKNKRFYFFYDRRFSIPKGYQVLPVVNLENPLNTLTGNPNLDAGKSHEFNMNYSNYDFKSRSGYYLYSNGTYNDNQIINTSIFDSNGRRLTTYTNISGTYRTSLGLYWNKEYKKEAHTYGVNFGFYSNFSLDKGYTNTQLYEAETFGFSPSLRFNYDYGELLSIRPSYNLNLNSTNYSNSTLNSVSNKLHNVKIEITNKWPKKWVIGNDFGYSYNSNISPGFKKDFYLWNTSLSYQFLKDNMSFKIKVYDILDQNQSASRYITPTAVIDTENTVLKRYAMFSLQYKFQEFAAKKK